MRRRRLKEDALEVRNYSGDKDDPAGPAYHEQQRSETMEAIRQADSWFAFVKVGGSAHIIYTKSPDIDEREFLLAAATGLKMISDELEEDRGKESEETEEG